MPLSSPVPRQHLHTRRIICEGFRRDDGLWDIEGHLTDAKTYSFPNSDRGIIEAGEPVHEMVVRLTVDDSLTIQAVEVSTEHAPFSICGTIAPHFQGLLGISMEKGYKRAVQSRFGGVHGCTHIVELLGRMATAAWQTIVPLRARTSGTQGPPSLIDTCHALAADGPIVARKWPEHAKK